MRLEIRPGLYRLWRAPGRLQIGLDARMGTVLDGLTAQDEYLISLLDGSVGLGGLLQRARRLGMRAERVHELLTALRDADLLVPRRTGQQALAHLDDDADQPGDDVDVVDDGGIDEPEDVVSDEVDVDEFTPGPEDEAIGQLELDFDNPAAPEPR
jgi:hypothetical protein